MRESCMHACKHTTISWGHGVTGAYRDWLHWSEGSDCGPEPAGARILFRGRTIRFAAALRLKGCFMNARELFCTHELRFGANETVFA